MKVFCSGSCRLLETMVDTDKLKIIHNLRYPHFSGNNFIGKFHDVKSHIQFIKFIKNLIFIDDNIKPRIFTCYNVNRWNDHRQLEPQDTIPQKLINLKNEIDNCDVYMFEICSLKLYPYKEFYCQHEQYENLNEYTITIQEETDLLADLDTLISFFPNKTIIFQCHFRPNIIYSDGKYTIEKREIIYNTLSKFCNKNTNCFLYDPSIILKDDHLLFDGDTHFTKEGFNASFKYICDNFL